MKEFVRVAVKVMQGGKFLVRGGKTEPMSGSAPAPRVIVIQYESFDKAKEWANAPATKDAFAIGHVWTVPAVQEESDYQRSVRVRSCIRPVVAWRIPRRDAAVMAAGPDVIR